MPKKKRRQRSFSFGLREIFLLLIGLAIPFSLYIVYLDRYVQQKFEGKRFAIPARVYARPLEMYQGKALTPKQLTYELKQLRYMRTDRTVQSGQYTQAGRRFVIYTRPFTFWDANQNAQQLEIRIGKNNTITSITDLDLGRSLTLSRLDPVMIGGIYPNQGEDRELVRLHQVPQSVIDALIAVEDRRFYEHHGIDPKALLRAISTLVTKERVHGGSTLTQQLVKNFFLTPERTIQRKLKEMIMAVLLERHYEKDEILETYINEVYFGQDKNRAVHGFALASQFYFARNIEHLEVHQAAMLVGLLKGPAYYNPRRHPERAQRRRDLVLSSMAEQGFISAKTQRKAMQQAIAISALPNRGQTQYPAFMDLVVRQLKRDYRDSDLRSEGLNIFTTIDPYEQSITEKTFSKQLTGLEKRRGLTSRHLQGAFVLVDIASAEVRALVGDRNPQYDGFNRALDASRQIGSLIKPAVYLTALERHEQFNLTSLLDDSPFTWREPGIEAWQPQNYDKKFHGQVPLWVALAKSYNVATARLGTELGVNNVLRTAHRLGIDKDLPEYASSLLGTTNLTPFEVAQMYHTVASGGFYSPFRAIRNVVTAEGVPLNRYSLGVKQAVSPAANYLLVSALQKVVSEGTAKGLNRYFENDVGTVAGKTGTTDDLRDSWFAGFTGDKVAVAWVGNDNNSSVGLTGASGAMKVWGETLSQLSSVPIAIPAPADIQFAAVSHTTGQLAIKNCAQAFELPFIEGSIPTNGNYCGKHKRNRVKSWFSRLLGKEK